MVKKYTAEPQSKESELNTPSAALVQNLLNYSKSVAPAKLKHRKVLVHLN
jgi:hypothetical protein